MTSLPDKLKGLLEECERFPRAEAFRYVLFSPTEMQLFMTNFPAALKALQVSIKALEDVIWHGGQGDKIEGKIASKALASIEKEFQ